MLELSNELLKLYTIEQDDRQYIVDCMNEKHGKDKAITAEDVQALLEELNTKVEEENAYELGKA